MAMISCCRKLDKWWHACLVLMGESSSNGEPLCDKPVWDQHDPPKLLFGRSTRVWCSYEAFRGPLPPSLWTFLEGSRENWPISPPKVTSLGKLSQLLDKTRTETCIQTCYERVNNHPLSFDSPYK